jgi:hypothetical protein
VQLPQADIKEKQKSPGDPSAKPPAPPQTEDRETTDRTPKKQGFEDIAKALHKPNSVLKIDTAKLAVMSPAASNKYIKEVSKNYLDELYGGHKSMFSIFDELTDKELARAILNDGEMERLAKEHGIKPKATQPQTPSERAMLVRNPTEYSYVIQCAKNEAKETSAITVLTPVYEVFHRIIESFNCSLGLEPVHNPTEATTIYKPEVAPRMLDETYVTNIVKEHYKDTLQFNFRLRTRADLINMLGRVKDYNIDGTKSLVAFLKENHLHLIILWKSPPSFREAAIIIGATKYNDLIKTRREIVHLLKLENKTYENSQLELKWRKKTTDDMTKHMLVISTDPSIHEAVVAFLSQRNRNLNPSEFQEMYDFRYHSPSRDEDEKSYNKGIALQQEFINQMTCAILSGIRHNLFTFTPNNTDQDHKWADDQSIFDKLIGNDEALYAEDSQSRESPFVKLHCTGKGWVITWKKADDEIAKTYLENHFAKDMAYWTKEKYQSIGVQYPLEQQPETDEDSETASTNGDNEPGETMTEASVDEFGRTARGQSAQKEKQAETASTEPMSQLNNQVATSNASSSLTAQTMRQNAQGHGNEYLPETLPTYSSASNTYQIPDNGQTMDIQQFSQLLKVVEIQTEKVMTTKLGTALAFYDPARGIKNMVVNEMNALHNTIKSEFALNHRIEPLHEKGSAIPRVRSLNDISQISAPTIARVTTKKISNDIATKATAAITDGDNRNEPPKVSASFAPNFNPYFGMNPMATEFQLSQGIEMGTPINTIIHPPEPGSYRGQLRDIGDEIMKTLDEQLKTADDSGKSTEIQEDRSIMETTDESEVKGDISLQDEANKEPRKLRPRHPPDPQRELNNQTQHESSTGEPPPSPKPGKSSRKKT